MDPLLNHTSLLIRFNNLGGKRVIDPPTIFSVEKRIPFLDITLLNLSEPDLTKWWKVLWHFNYFTWWVLFQELVNVRIYIVFFFFFFKLMLCEELFLLGTDLLTNTCFCSVFTEQNILIRYSFCAGGRTEKDQLMLSEVLTAKINFLKQMQRYEKDS